VAGQEASSYLEYLPRIYRATDSRERVNFFGRYLKVFEHLLTGRRDALDVTPGVEETLGRIHRYFDPLSAPSEFVELLASWVAVRLAGEWPEAKRRRFVAEVVPLYKKRGTVEGLTNILRIYIGPDTAVEDVLPDLQTGINTVLDGEMRLGGFKPHFFVVHVALSFDSLGESPGREFVAGVEQTVKVIVDAEKPAHTYYSIAWDFPGIQIGQAGRSEVGLSSLVFRRRTGNRLLGANYG
jgi:phage tail-like protein